MSKPDYTPHFLFRTGMVSTVNGRVSQKHIRIPDPNKYVNPLRKNDTTITKGKFTVATPDTVGKHINKLNILQVSHELDLYFKSVLAEQCKHEVTDNCLSCMIEPISTATLPMPSGYSELTTNMYCRGSFANQTCGQWKMNVYDQSDKSTMRRGIL